MKIEVIFGDVWEGAKRVNLRAAAAGGEGGGVGGG